MSSTYCKKVSLSRLRVPSEADRHNICYWLNKAREDVADSDITKLSDPAYAVDCIVSGEVDSLILDNALLLVYTVGSPWYSERVFLQERLLLRIGGGSSFREACNLLDDLAEEYEADDILVGTALARNPEALARMYRRHGYTVTGNPSLIKRR